MSPSIRGRSDIDVVEDDIAVNKSYSRCFDVVRAANILNLGYFDKPTLVAMVLNLRERIRDNGRLVVCRTDRDNVNHGTVVRARCGAPPSGARPHQRRLRDRAHRAVAGARGLNDPVTEMKFSSPGD
ncbi:MAG: hypothetical protein WDO56_21900 [Gammaproteobacteria bacterium]